jgi:hypothetical protein
MNTSFAKKRKLIDIPVETLQILSIKAAIGGTNVKNLIENMLLMEADKIDAMAEAEIYTNLLINDPEGKEFLNEEDTLNFEKQLGI